MADPTTEDLPGDAEETETEDLTGLKSALGRLKTERSTLKTELAKSKAELAFFHSVPKGLKNPRAARVLATEFGLVKEDGTLDADAFKKQFPEMFNSAPTANAGEGTQKPAESGSTMNEWIRKKAGRK